MLIILLVLDYQYNKVIPNFFFLGDFTKDNVEAYWKAVISVVATVISLLTLLQTFDKFFLEKQIHNENQKKETIRRYQDLVRSAIEILNDKSEDEGACLFAIQIMQNVVSLYGKNEFTRTLEKQSEPFQIISVEGILCLLKKHLDQVWCVQRPNDEIRQDVLQVMRFMYANNGLWTYEDLKRCGLHRFKDVYINMEYFDGLLLKGMQFINVVFNCDNEYTRIFFDGNNEFTHCKFNCDYTTFLKPYGAITFRECELQGYEMVEFDDIIQDKEIIGTKKVKFIETKCKGFVNLSDNIFHSLIIESSTFLNAVHMHRIEVSSEMIVTDTEFLAGLDFQGSTIEWKILFKNSLCKAIFYFGETKFYKKSRIDFYEFYIDEFPASNWSAEIYEDKHQPMLNDQVYCFKDMFKIIQDEENKGRKLVNKQ